MTTASIANHKTMKAFNRAWRNAALLIPIDLASPLDTGFWVIYWKQIPQEIKTHLLTGGRKEEDYQAKTFNQISHDTNTAANNIQLFTEAALKKAERKPDDSSASHTNGGKGGRGKGGRGRGKGGKGGKGGRGKGGRGSHGNDTSCPT